MTHCKVCGKETHSVFTALLEPICYECFEWYLKIRRSHVIRKM